MRTPLTRAVVDLEAVSANVAGLRAITSPGARIMAVVKADAYGHGAVRISEAVLAAGADALGVARIEEAVTLRKSGITAPILIFGQVPEPDIRDLVDQELTATVFSLETGWVLSRVAEALGKRIRVHVKIDTGMGRLGVLSHRGCCGEALSASGAEVLAVSKLPGLILEGIYTHFATADSSDKRFATTQFVGFLDLLAHLKQAGLEIPIRHAANSSALIDMPETHLDMVRPGIALYGLYASESVDRSRVPLRPAMSLKTRVIHLKKVPARFPVSYGCTYETPSPTVIATVPVGYADGFRRGFSNRGHMLVHGRKAPVAGRVCMDLTMLDVGHIPETALGDDVVVFGTQEGAVITADDLAAMLDTISYEIVTTVSDRIPRHYRGGPIPSASP